ncbi:lipoprotein [Spiroplasma sp. ChiS]|uniref:lipoprotein n=1 Tax=Spiroplasma sp. ChiS TaxID=2099885 RepID=UPI000CFA030E|nr:lipoprotein [Spiroplasma sp. ChiS]
MKRLLSIIGAISLLGTSTTNVVACNAPQEYTSEELKELKEKNKIDTADENIKNNLEWIAPQEKPFNTVDNKWYYVVWRSNEKDNWRIVKFKSDNFKTIDKFNNFELQFFPPKNKVIYGLLIGEKQDWGYKPIKIWIDDKNNSHFKSVYRWNLDTQEPDLVVDNEGNIKVNEE